MGQIILSYLAAEAAVALGGVAAAGVVAQLGMTSVTLPTRAMGLVGLTVTLASAVATELGLVYAATDGTPTAPGTRAGVKVNAGNGGPGGAVDGALYSAWSAAPTYTANTQFRWGLMPNVIGSKIEWTWPEDDPLLLSSVLVPPSLLLVNLGGGATGSLRISTRWLEYIPQP